MTYIIAEAGVNHNGSLEIAKQLVMVAKQSGADAVKFQTFKAENLVTKHAPQASYQIQNLGERSSQLAMLRKLELSYDEFLELKRYCDDVEIQFLSTPFDLESVDFLIRKLDMEKIKISSGEMTNLPFLYNVAAYRKPIIVSTGMATMDEIHEALAYIAYGLAEKKQMDEKLIWTFYKSKQAKQLLEQYVTVLHCTTEYPAPFNTINLKAITQLKAVMNIKIGLSDHSQGIAIPIAAVALGAEVIEKHFTLDKNMEGPDHIASLEPQELKDMVLHIRQIELALGDGIKRPSSTELINRVVARKSIVAKSNIVAGEIFSVDNIVIKRPGSGMSPSQYWNLLGKASSKSYCEDELINE